MPENIKLIDQCHIQINTQDAPYGVMQSLQSITVEQGLHLPALCLLRFQDDELELTDSSIFAIGNQLQVELGIETAIKPIFDGEVTGIELEPNTAGTLNLVVRAYDRSHRLHRGCHTRSFTQVTDSDLAMRIAQEVGLKPDIDATHQVYEYILQDNRTNYQFLHERADRIGFAFWVESNTLHFSPVAAGFQANIKLEWGKSLLRFHPVQSATHQVDEICVRGWDPGQKQTIIGRASKGNAYVAIGKQQPGSQLANRTFGPAQRVIVDRPIQNQAEADALAQALCDELSNTYIQAEGQTTGNPELSPGVRIDIANVGDRFGGVYTLTSTTHILSTRTSYKTEFSACGSQAQPLLKRSQPIGGGRVWVCIGQVTNIQDPQEMGRVKVKFPWLSDEVESTWARLVAPSAGGNRGFYWLPEIDDEVVVAFEHGDMTRAFILGALWNGQDQPPLQASEAVNAQGQVVQRILRSRTGHTILMDDRMGKEQLVIQDEPNHHKITMDRRGISLKDNCGNSIELDSKGINIQDQSGNTIMMRMGGPLGKSISINGNTQVVLRPLVDWLLAHKHVCSTGGPTPLSPDDMTSLTARLVPGGGLLSDEVTVK